MSFGGAIYNLLLGPLELFFEVVYTLAFKLVHNQGLAIIFLSLAMNFLVLPLYKQADKMQAKERDIELMLKPGVKHIKKTFKGDEQYMMLQTYYRQNNYRPTDTLKGSVSLLLEIPFFIAAYHFLSHLNALNGITFGPIKDLGAPDALLTVFGVTLNLLPILMTLINFISSAIYLKGFPLKSKIQLYGIAIIFLVFLYKSPAGLVFYWTLNNLFSLCKNIAYKIPWKQKSKNAKEDPVPQKSLFYAATISLSILLGLLIPSAVLASSPTEFISITMLNNPLGYLIGSLTLSVGLFIIWFSVFRMLAGDRGKNLMGFIAWALSIVFLFDYMCFAKELGTITNTLMFESTPIYEQKGIIVNLVSIVLIVVALYFIWKKKYEIAKYSAVIISLTLLVMSVTNIISIQKEVKPALEVYKTTSEQETELPLSKTKQNVVVIMMDRATSAYIPFILNEDPTVREQFDGFTYYPNTASFGAHTLLAASAIWGGYEYTPAEMDKRSDELLADKYDESLLILPTLFSEAGYNVAITDPPFAGYEWVPDFSIYDGLENTKEYITIGNNSINDVSLYQSITKGLNRNFFCYSFFKVSPLCLQTLLYNNGLYNAANIANIKTEQTDLTNIKAEDMAMTGQVMESITKATGTNSLYNDNYAVLENLNNFTKVSDKGGFLLITNELTHRPTLLQEPGYTYSPVVDNSSIYREDKITKTDAEGNQIDLKTKRQVSNYQVNMVALRLLGNWFDYLKANDLFDNTKIIIVSDHGWSLEQYPDRIIGGKVRNDDNSNSNDTMYFNSLLMVKDFNQSGEPTTDNTFMTTADVPVLAIKDTDTSTINPFTNKDIVKQVDKDKITILGTHNWDVEDNRGNTYDTSALFTVHDNIFDLNNWEKIKANK